MQAPQFQYAQPTPDMGARMQYDPSAGYAQPAYPQVAQFAVAPQPAAAYMVQPQVAMVPQPQMAMMPQPQPAGMPVAPFMGEPIILPLDRTKGPEWEDFNRRRNQTISQQGYTTMQSARPPSTPQLPAYVRRQILEMLTLVCFRDEPRAATRCACGVRANLTYAELDKS